MDVSNSSPNSQSGISARAYLGDGSVLLAFNLDPGLTANLAGFAIQRTAPGGQVSYLPNRLSFSSGMTSQTTPEQRTWSPSDQAPFQKFRWVDVPPEIVPGVYTYQITAMYFTPGGGLQSGAWVELPVDLQPVLDQGDFKFGFTRGYASSQAYRDKFNNAPIEPSPRSLDFETQPFEAQYAWLGFHARQLMYDFIQECINDPAITVDLFAYDLDEPQVIRWLQQLGPRLRAVLDNAPLHTKPGALEPQARALLQASAGTGNIKVGHFKRFSHSKVLIQKKNGQPVKVLTGSANFSLRGLYVQANNVLVLDDPLAAGYYEQAFQAAFTSMPAFTKASIAGQWFDLNSPGFPQSCVAFSPHKDPTLSLSRVSTALTQAHSSVLYAVMELDGGGPVLQQLQSLGDRNDIFAYGVTQNANGLKLYKPGQSNGIFTSFAYLTSKVPGPFQAEWSGGAGQVIHHKFVVVDFNDQHPVVFTGSSNLAEGGESDNGDNLLAIYHPAVVTAYAVEAIRLVDHYHFRTVMQTATQEQPLQLAGPGTDWWQPYYDPAHAKYHERNMFSPLESQVPSA